jgi:hypothetical protein
LGMGELRRFEALQDIPKTGEGGFPSP